jgi:hypothetical protein
VRSKASNTVRIGLETGPTADRDCNIEPPSEACDLLAPIYGEFTEGFDTPELRQAKALLNALR